MSSLAIRHESNAIAAPLPAPRVGPITIRKAMLPPPGGAGSADFMFIDELQKNHSNMDSFMPKDQLENYISAANVLLAQARATTDRITAAHSMLESTAPMLERRSAA